MSFLDRCTEGAKRALALAQEAARAMGHNYVGSEHLLLGLIREGEGAAFKALSAFGVKMCIRDSRSSVSVFSEAYSPGFCSL